jgi:hypothetical protein
MMKRTAKPQSRSGTAKLENGGVDRSLIRWTLSLSPRQRLEVLEEHLRGIRALRRDVPTK